MTYLTKTYGKFRQNSVEAEDFTIYFDFWDGVFVQHYIANKPGVDLKLDRAFASEAADRLYTEYNNENANSWYTTRLIVTRSLYNLTKPADNYDPFEPCLVRFRK